MSHSSITRGQCLCGGIRFEIRAPLAPIQVCHCRQCRKAQGAAIATNIPVRSKDFVLLAGAELMTDYESSPGKIRTHCGRCGSPVISRRSELPDQVRVRAGLLDGDLDVRPALHFHVASKANWWEICDNLPQYPEACTPSP